MGTTGRFIAQGDISLNLNDEVDFFVADGSRTRRAVSTHRIERVVSPSLISISSMDRLSMGGRLRCKKLYSLGIRSEFSAPARTGNKQAMETSNMEHQAGGGGWHGDGSISRTDTAGWRRRRRQQRERQRGSLLCIIWRVQPCGYDALIYRLRTPDPVSSLRLKNLRK